MDQGIVRADKSLRMKLILFLILLTIVVILIEPTVNRYIEQIKQISEKNPELALKKSIIMPVSFYIGRMPLKKNY